MEELHVSQPLLKIRLDGGTQLRVSIRQDKVKEYAEKWKAGVEFPPVVLFFDEKIGVFWLADGFHRYYGAEQAGLLKIPAVVHQGTQRDAILYAARANEEHGVQRTQADRKNAVEKLLRDPEWSGWSNCEIARCCNLGANGEVLVRRMRARLSSSVTKMPTERKVRRGGKEYTVDTSKIGKHSIVAPTAAGPATAPASSFTSPAAQPAAGPGRGTTCPHCGGHLGSER
jgi:hypothetical protein